MYTQEEMDDLVQTINVQEAELEWLRGERDRLRAALAHIEQIANDGYAEFVDEDGKVDRDTRSAFRVIAIKARKALDTGGAG